MSGSVLCSLALTACLALRFCGELGSANKDSSPQDKHHQETPAGIDVRAWVVPARYADKFEEIRRLLESPNWRDRYSVIKRFVDDGASDGIPILKRLLGDAYPNVRIEAARAIGTLGGPRDYHKLVAVLTDVNAGVRAVAAQALGKLGNPDAIRALEKSERDPNPDVLEKSQVALARLGVRRIIEAAIGRLSSPNLRDRREAALFLGEANCLVAVPDLVRLLSDDSLTGDILSVSGPEGGGVVHEKVSDVAALALSSIAGNNLGFKWDATEKDRKENVKRWKHWLKEHVAEIEEAKKELR